MALNKDDDLSILKMRREIARDLRVIIGVGRYQDHLCTIHGGLDIRGGHFNRRKVLRAPVDMDSLCGPDARNLGVVFVKGAQTDALHAELGEQAFAAHSNTEHRPNVILAHCHRSSPQLGVYVLFSRATAVPAVRYSNNFQFLADFQ